MIIIKRCSWIILCLVLANCSSMKRSQTQNMPSLPFTIQILKDSRETILTQTLPWEEQMMGYYKVLKTSANNWQMWYSSWDNKRKDDYSGYLVYAYSKNGKDWVKALPGKENNILRGTGHPQKDGIVEQDVVLSSAGNYKYQMMYTAKDSSDNGKEKTFTEESTDGMTWANKKILWNRKHDSQFSIVQHESLYHIYLRYWDVKDNIRYRTIGLAITDLNFNVIAEPRNILRADFSSDYPHLYNPAASKLGPDLDILFPTFFNEKTNAIKFGLAYVYKNNPVLTDMNLTQDLLDGTNTNWGIICPGLIPTGEKNTYWLYYYATNMVHSDYDKAGRKFTYFRIKIKLKEK